MRLKPTVKKTFSTIILLAIFLIIGTFGSPAIAQQKLIEVLLDGATEYEASEVMSKVLNSTHNILQAKRYSTNVVPQNAKKSWTTWRVTYDESAPARLQSNIMTTIKQVLNAKGKLTLKGAPTGFTTSELTILKKIRSGSATKHRVQFVFNH